MHPILALETSTATCGVALYSRSESSESLCFKELSGVSGHAPNILPLVDDVMREAGLTRQDLAAIAFGQGPGAFTGVRLACSVAQGMSFALQIPIVPVGALPALAAGVAYASPPTSLPRICLVALDARMNEVYLAAYVLHDEQSLNAQSASLPGCFELQSPVLIRSQDCLAFIAARLPYWLRTFANLHTLVLAGDGWRLIARDDLVAAVDQICACQNLVWQDLFEDYGTVSVKQVARLGWDLFHRGRRLEPEQALPLYLRDKVAFTTAERALGQGGNPQALQSGSALILPMSLADLREVVELERQSQAFPWSEGHFSDALAAGYSGWVLRQAGELVGFCVAMAAPDEVHLLVIAVSPGYRRQGYGALLLEQVYMFGRQQCASRVLLEVRSSNTSAIAFYRWLQFEQIGTRRGYYPAAKGQREDALVMARSLHGEQTSHD